MRKEHWERSFFDYLLAAETRPFLWGQFDCCLFVAGAAQSVTGIDVTQDFPPFYSDEEGAREYLAKMGGLPDLFDAAFLPLGAARISPLYAKRGDIMLLELPSGEGFEMMGAVVMGRDVTFLTDQGMRSVSLPVAAGLSAQAWSFK